jgi:hypothetical protein
MELAKIFGAQFIVDSPYIPKSIRETISKMGKTILLFEGGKSLKLDRKVINSGVKGALNVMKQLGMQEGPLDIDVKYTLLIKNKWLRAPYSGIFEPLVTNGSNVKHKAIIGKIYDPFGEFERTIKSPFDCCIYGLNTAPIVYKGDAIFHVSIEKE